MDMLLDADVCEALSKQVVTRLFENADVAAGVRVWVPGGATGQEAYCIATLLREYLLTRPDAPKAVIFVTDNDAAALTIARGGRYQATPESKAAASRIERFFHASGGEYLVSKEVREMCVFSRHDVVRDMPFSRLDLIVCRRMLPKLGEERQDDLLSLFHYALNPGGFLLLDVADAVKRSEDLFSAVDAPLGIFQRRATLRSPAWISRRVRRISRAAHDPELAEVRSGTEEQAWVNEELMAAKEELLTSREELKVTNAELYAVNAALAAKIGELQRASDELRTLFESTQIATVFLDRSLGIRSYTPSIVTIFNLTPSDRGRALTDFTHQIENVDLRADIRQVLQRGEPLERAVRLRDRKVFHLMRILPYHNAADDLDGVLVTFVNVTAMMAAEEQQRVVVAELNHRVRNLLQIVIGLANQTLLRSDDLKMFERSFMGRLEALARAYQLLSRDDWRTVPLKDLLRTQLTAFAAERRYSVNGEDCILSAQAALALGMIIYELGTNAIRYGALSVGEGYIDITWLLSDTELVFSWIERNGPVVKEPTHRGFGSDLVQRQLRYELNGEVTIEFASSGVRVQLALPAHHVVQTEAYGRGNQKVLDA